MRKVKLEFRQKCYPNHTTIRRLVKKFEESGSEHFLTWEDDSKLHEIIWVNEGEMDYVLWHKVIDTLLFKEFEFVRNVLKSDLKDIG